MAPTPGQELDDNIPRQRARDEALMEQGRLRREIDAELKERQKKLEAETLTKEEATDLLHFIYGDSHMMTGDLDALCVKLQNISGEEW